MYPFNETLIIVLVVAAATLATRAFPFVLFGGKKEVPEKIKYLGAVLPPAVIAILVIYCFKDVSPFAYPHGMPELIAAVIVAVVHIWKRNNLISIATGTVAYMFMVQTVFLTA